MLLQYSDEKTEVQNIWLLFLVLYRCILQLFIVTIVECFPEQQSDAVLLII